MSAGIRKKSTRRLSTAQAQSSIETKHLQHPILFPKEERESVFTDFGTLVAELRKELQGNITKPQDPATAERITNLLSSFRLNPKEWGQYTHFIGNRYTRLWKTEDRRFGRFHLLNLSFLVAAPSEILISVFFVYLLLLLLLSVTTMLKDASRI